MDANEGVQSFNFEVGQKFKSFKEFESQLKHYQNAKFIQMYRRSSCKFESTKTNKQFMEAEILFPISKETTEWNCSVCKIDVHLYASIVCDGCLEWNHLKCVGLKALHQNPRTGYADSAITKESNLIISYVIPSL